MRRELGRWRAYGVLWLGLVVVPALHAQGQPAARDVIADRSLTPEAVLQALDPSAVRARSLRIGRR